MGIELATGDRLRVLELYCGLGGLAAALEDVVAAGTAEVVAAVDIHGGALRGYAHNFDHPTRVANLEGMPADAFRELAADLWWMSPPCQPFTRRGRRRDAEDPRARSFLRLLDILAEVRPGYLAMENVPGFRGSETHARLREVLDSAGYGVREWILCPTEFGIPNRRRRFYLVAGLSRPSPKRPSPPWPASPSPGPLPSGRGATLAGNTSSREDRERITSYLDPEPEPGLEVDPDLLHHYRHAVDVVDVEDPRAVTATFTAAYGHSPVRSGSFLRAPDGSVRYFSPREVLRLLGFPESYRLPPDLTRTQGWRLAGNSLSLAPVRAVLSSIPELVVLGTHCGLTPPQTTAGRDAGRFDRVRGGWGGLRAG